MTVHSVMRWRKPKEKGGTGGVIPHWHIDDILLAAKARGIDIRETDFLPVSKVAR
ncbi:hypothetical protein [Sinorhizobium sp. A49]|uniref:hypothetical protein n=1 Tax=Sinorhizobium sp. A49 TaxID=1945861 RepID=UPI0015C53683|nr:hypothetical protein [Sinorhizobium sp. A49]